MHSSRNTMLAASHTNKAGTITHSSSRAVVVCRRSPYRFTCSASSAVATTTTSAAFTAPPSSSSSGKDPRKYLQAAIADQLTGPHFNTWLDSSRFNSNSVVMQARRLWYYSALLAPDALGTERQFTPIQLAQAQSAADTAFAELQRFRLPSGGWRFSLNPASSDDKDQVLIYGVCFVLYALSTYYDATQSDHARVLANELFDNMAARLAPDGGIAPEAFEVDFITPLGGPGSADAVKNGLGHYNDRRSVNTHIHLLETLTAYHALVPAGVKGTARQARSAQAVKAAADLIVAMKDGPRLVELRDLGDATKPASNLRKPQAGSNSQTDGEKLMFLPGHNVEATFLVHDAFDTLGLPGPDATFTQDILEEAHSWRQAFTLEGPAAAPVYWLPHICVNTTNNSPTAGKEAWRIGEKEWEAEVSWWVQMELLNALVHADQRLGGPGRAAGDKYIDRALEVWQLVSTRFVEPKSGALYEALDQHSLQPKYEARTFGRWKASYHSSRALLRSLQALCKGFKQGTLPETPVAAQEDAAAVAAAASPAA